MHMHELEDRETRKSRRHELKEKALCEAAYDGAVQQRRQRVCRTRCLHAVLCRAVGYAITCCARSSISKRKRVEPSALHERCLCSGLSFVCRCPGCPFQPRTHKSAYTKHVVCTQTRPVSEEALMLSRFQTKASRSRRRTRIAGHWHGPAAAASHSHAARRSSSPLS